MINALVAPSGECLRGEGLVWLIGAVVCSLAAAVGPIVRYDRMVKPEITNTHPTSQPPSTQITAATRVPAGTIMDQRPRSG